MEIKEIIVPSAPAIVKSVVEIYFSSLPIWIIKALIRPLMGRSIPAEQANATRIFCPTMKAAVSAEEVDPIARKANGR